MESDGRGLGATLGMLTVSFAPITRLGLLMKDTARTLLTFTPFRALIADRADGRFCDRRRKTDDSQCGQSRTRSGYCHWPSPLTLLLVVSESHQIDSLLSIASRTGLHEALKRFSALESYVLFVCSVRWGRAVAGRLKRRAVTLPGPRPPYRQSLQQASDPTRRNPCVGKRFSVARKDLALRIFLYLPGILVRRNLFAEAL
jgi:hypothetical protein